MKAALYRYGPAIFFALCIPVLSLLPAFFFRNVPQPARFPGADKIIHTLMYAVLTLAFIHAIHHPLRSPARSAALAALLATLYGLALEILQGALTTTRAFDLYDALANAAGAILAALLAYLWFRRAPSTLPS